MLSALDLGGRFMSDTAVPFAEVLEAAGKLTLPEQEELVDILRRRAIEQRRAEIVKDIRDAEQEFQSGGCRPTSPDELMKEILS
jgi:hypothetical protein